MEQLQQVNEACKGQIYLDLIEAIEIKKKAKVSSQCSNYLRV